MKQLITPNKYLSFKQPSIYLLLAIGIILTILYVSLLSGKNKMAENLLTEKMDLVEHNMTDFFSTVEKAFIISYKRGKSGAYQDLDIKALNQHFSPILEGFESISAINLADEKGNDYMLKYYQGSFMNRITKGGGKKKSQRQIEWSKIKETSHILKEDTIDIIYDPRLRPWFIGGMNIKEASVFWTQPYQFSTSNLPGITISKHWTDSTGIKKIISFDVSILDISKFTSQMEISAHGKAFIVTEDGHFLGLPKDVRFKSENDLLNYLLINTDSINIPEILAAKNEFHKQAQKKELYSFKFEGENYFFKVKPFVLGTNTFQICLLMPEKDLTQDIQMIVWLVILIILVIALMAVLMIKAFHDNRRANQLLFEQKQELETKNQEIEDSVLYTRHLQSAILPSYSRFKNLFPQSFILYQPKDIVSGDFYWEHSFDQMVYFAVADCTGHGVPGAMISVVCANALNRVIKEDGIIEPGKILDHVKDQVVETFSQNEDAVSDGMDIALCCIDLDIKKLWYSGANNPLYRIGKKNDKVDALIKLDADSNKALYEYPATRQPIGKVTDTKKFKTHEIDLEQGDCIYLFTDGFLDQFGGPKGKKYKSKPFKKFLLKISEESMEEQHLLLENEFETWKGDLEQVDDICILGMKI